MAIRQIKLGMFYWPCGHHLAAWRHPDAVPDSGANLTHIIKVAQLAEEGLFDLFFMADSVSFWRGDLNAMAHDSYGAWIEPFTLMCALSQHTRNLGLVCTGTTSFDQPYLLARRFASLDLSSGGRAGWNLVTSGNPAEANSFGLAKHIPKVDRYRRGREFAYAVRGLWNSFDDDALIRDVPSGRYLDVNKLHVLEHHGEFFALRGPLNVPPSPQGEPVMVQAGASDEGKELAAEFAEVVFAVQSTIEGAKSFYADVKRRMASYGRDPDSLKIMPGLFPCIGRTQTEAEGKFEQLQDLIVPEVGLQLLSNRIGYDLSGQDVDKPLPEIPRHALSSSRVELFVDMARREKLTIRELYRRIAGARGHYQFIGTGSDLADLMEQWITEEACDGFNIMPPVFPAGLREFNEWVVPELQRRGLYRRNYEATTLRGNLGSPASLAAEAAKISDRERG
jgi:FMN-dependent oxidoreductase (nitrilotriacetate monooxygenase family)